MRPLATGVLSDLFASLAGGNAAIGLRNAMMVQTVLLLWGALHWVAAARILGRPARA